MAEQDKKKQSGRAFQKPELPAGVVQHAKSFDAIVDGDYGKAVHVLQVFRQLVRIIDQRQTKYEVATAMYGYDPDHGVEVVIDKEAAVKAALQDTPPVNVRKVKLRKKTKSGKKKHRWVVNGEPVSDHGPLTGQVNIWRHVCQVVADAGGPHLGSHIWDQMKNELPATRKTALKDYNGASRDWLVAQGVFESLKLERYMMPFMRYASGKPNSSRVYARLKKDERGIVLTVQYGTKDDTIDFVLDGRVPKPDGEYYTAHINRKDERWYILRMLMKNPDWDLRLVKVGLREGKNRNGHDIQRFKIQISYRRPPRTGPKGTPLKDGMPDLDESKCCEVVWDRVMGHELKKRPWKDSGRDDPKTFIIHAAIANNSNSEDWGKHIAVDGVVGYFRYLQRRKSYLGLVRDGRRRVRRRLCRQAKDTISLITERRIKQEHDYNRCWSKDVVFFALRARCKTIKLFNVPDGAKSGLLLDGSISWNWCEFVTRVKDLAKEKGMKVITCDDLEAGKALGQGMREEAAVCSA
ncbi:MAG: hypothetical protein WBE26_09315 [Phycisphaerae bacterium]